MRYLFVSDLHLDDARPAATQAFLQFLTQYGRNADALYILGDLFESWVGDDDPAAAGAAVADGLSGLADSGVAVYFMHGNRDFLLGDDYAKRCQMQLINDPHVIDLHGTATLLGHGDLLCTDDRAYQDFRAQTRNLQWQQTFLAQPLAARLAFAEQARTASRARYQDLSAQGSAETITDVNPDAVNDAFITHKVQRIIHGHTHRPAIHQHPHGQRIVLGDWYNQPSALQVDADNITVLPLPLQASSF